MAETVIRKEVSSAGLVMETVDRIVEAISAGQYSPGDRLMESNFCQLLGLGRVPVREALRVLAGDGVVELVNNRGARLRPIPLQEIIEMLKVQDALAGFAVGEFVQQKNRASFYKRLERHAKNIDGSMNAGRSRDVLREMVKFHQVILEGSNNSYLINISRRHYLSLYELHFSNYADQKSLRRPASTHLDVVDALKKKNAESARRLIHEKNMMAIELLQSSSLRS